MQEKLLIIAKPYDAEVMRKTLVKAGYQVVVAQWGEDALPATIERETPLTVLISLRKNQAGLEGLLASIRAGRCGGRVPVLLIGEPRGPITTPEQAAALGADQLILRPLDPGQLDQALRALLAEARVSGTKPLPVVDGAAPSLESDAAAPPPELTAASSELASDISKATPAAAEPVPPAAPAASLVMLPRAGELESIGIPRLLLQAHREGLTGKLVLRRGEITKVVFFDDGDPVFATSEQPNDRMGAFLRRQGKITDAQYEELQQHMRGADERLGSILVRKGYIKHRELSPLVRDHVAEIIYSLFSWGEGEYRIDDAGELVVERIKLESPPVLLIFEGVRRKYGLHRLRPLVGAPGVKLRARSQAGVRARQYGFPEEAARALEQLDGNHTLEQLVERAHLDELALYQLCYVALLVGLAVRGPRQAGAAEEERGAASPRDGALDRMRIQSKHAQVCEGTYFNLLGLQTDATGHEVLRAFERLRGDFSPGAIAPEIVTECAEQINEINEVIDEAFRVLRDDALREAYRRSIT